VALLLVFMLVPLAVMLLFPGRPPGPRPTAPKKKGPPASKKKVEALAVPDTLQLNDFPRLGDAEKGRLAARLRELGKRVGVELSAEPDDLAESLATLDQTLDTRLGAKKPRRDPGPLGKVGAPQQQLRALLWKHGVPEYNQPGLSAVELVERLEKKLAAAGALKEPSGE
jgi:hypothetical protein